jgi:hypothetical protein
MNSTWKERFKAQWTEEDWQCLLISHEFVEAWNANDEVKCGERAAEFLYGNADTKADAKAYMEWIRKTRAINASKQK